MWAITLHDLRFRARQFLIAVVGAALVFAIGLLQAGLAASFRLEVTRLVRGLGADTWVIPAGSSGPLTSFATLQAPLAAAVAATPGVRAADPVAFIPESAVIDGRAFLCELLGRPAGGLGDLPPSAGREPASPGEAVADARLHAGIGRTIVLGGRRFTIVGVTHGRTFNAGIPIVSVGLADAQAVAFGGQPLATAILVRGTPTGVPPGLQAMSSGRVQSDSLRPLSTAIQSVHNAELLMWVVAAIIVAALLYVSALERVRDFAVLKSIGSSSMALFAGVAAQSVIVTLAGAVVAAAVANLMKPVFPLPVAIPTSAFVILPLVAVGIGVLASLVALRRAVGADPSLAFSAS